MTPTWHYQPNPEHHRTACGRWDNTTLPFAMTDDERDVTCERCMRTLVFREAAFR